MLERHPNGVLLLGVLGISISAILVRYSQAPSVITAVYPSGLDGASAAAGGAV